MSTLHGFTFHPSTASLAFSAIALALALWLTGRAIRRSGFRREQMILEAIRLFLIVCGILWLNQPEWVHENSSEELPTIAILVDQSRSMNTRDEVRDGGDEWKSGVTERIERRERLETLASQADALKSNGLRVSTISFSSDQADSTTDIATPLEAALDQAKNLRAVVIASDGDWNSGRPPSEIADRYRLRGIPIFAIPVGSTEQLPDIELLNFDVPTFGIVGKRLQIPITIASSLPQSTNVKVRLRNGDDVIEEKDVVLQPMGRTQSSLSWKPMEPGDFALEASLGNESSDMFPENNRREAKIAIREERLKVLIVESYPRWEYRYLRNALSRDPGVDLTCLLFQPGLSKPGGGNKDYIPEFPSTFEELSEFDVVFLGDVGLEEGQLNEEQCRMLQGLVQKQASGLVFMPGWQGRQMSLLNSPLSELMPVVLDTDQAEGWGSRTPGQFELTELGRRSLLTRLADSAEDNLLVWENLPGFQWHAAVQRTKAGAEVLAVHRDAMSGSSRSPLLVTQTYGVGKVLFMGTDGAWRWRKGVEDLYHYRFWGQVVRWMAYQRNMAKGQRVRLYYSPDQPSVGQTIFLNANISDDNGEPLSKAQVSVKITSPSGRSSFVSMASVDDEWGAYRGTFTPFERGEHRLLLSAEGVSETIEAAVLILGQDQERLGKPARPEVLAELAQVSGGESIEPSKMVETILAMAYSQSNDREVNRWKLWSNAWLGATLIGAMAAFWVGRKMCGQF